MATVTSTEHPHIVRVAGIAGGRPVIRGTRISVLLIARFLNQGVDVDELLATYPHLTAAQVHDALSYYFDHKATIDAEIEELRPDKFQEAHGFDIGPNGIAHYRTV